MNLKKEHVFGGVMIDIIKGENKMHINRGFSGPCLCGADDCPRCFPAHFDRKGRYIDDEYDPTDVDDREFEDDDKAFGDNPDDDYIAEGPQDPNE